MNAEEQAKFVNDLAGSILEDLLSDIAKGKTPATWNGYELRRWVSERMTEGANADHLRMDRSRARAYNTVRYMEGI